MTDIVPVPAMPTVPLYPALGSANFNNEAYAYGSSMRGVSQWQNAIGLSCYTNALVSHERATTAVSASSTAVAAKDITVAAKDVAVSAKDTAVASANTASSAAATATAGANTATVQADRAQDLVDSISNITTGPVIAFNDRAGAVTLQSGDVTAALGFDPVKPYVVLPAGTDLNGVVVSGFYRLNTPANGPGSLADYGQLIVSRGDSTIFQIASSHDNGFSFCRQGNISGSLWVFTRWVPIGRKPVNIISDTGGYMAGTDGVASLNAINVWTYATGAVTKRLPKSPANGDECTIIIYNGRNDNVLQQAETGERIMGLDETMTIDHTNIAITFVYVGGAYDWRII